MQYALSLPNFDAHWHPRKLAALAREAEEAGWDGFFIWDHILFDPFNGLAISDPWVALAAIALATTRIRIGPMVTPLPRRRPWKLAREVVSIDHLSDGRLTLGVGLGAPVDEEFAFVGEETDNKIRAARLDEGLDILAGLLSGQKFGYEGTHYHLKPTVFLPPPVQQPRVPVWVAGTVSEAGVPRQAPMRRAARWDGFFPIHDSGGNIGPAQFGEMAAYVRQHRATDAPFDLIAAGATPGDDPTQADAIVAPFAAAGATWWIEDLAMWRFKEWNPWKEPYIWPVEEIEARIRQGPPH